MTMRSIHRDQLLVDREEVLHIFFFNDTATTEIYTLSQHDALPIAGASTRWRSDLTAEVLTTARPRLPRSEEHTSELQSRENLVCRLLLEKKKKQKQKKFKI